MQRLAPAGRRPRPAGLALLGSVLLHGGVMFGLATALPLLLEGPPPAEPWVVELAMVDPAPAAAEDTGEPQPEPEAPPPSLPVLAEAPPPPVPPPPAELPAAEAVPAPPEPMPPPLAELPTPEPEPTREVVEAPPPVPPPPAPPRPVPPRPVPRRAAPAATEPTGPALAAAEPAAAPALPPPAPLSAPALQDPAYARALFAWLQRHHRYPYEARQQALEGRVQMRVRLNRRGEVIQLAVLEHEGDALFVEASREMLRRASPFPAPPESLPGDAVEFTVPITYRLTR